MLVINICNGLTILPQGVRGGLASQAGYQAKIAADGTCEVYETDAYCHLEPGSRLHAIDNGGGGYGDPLEPRARAGPRRCERALRPPAPGRKPSTAW